MNDKKNNVLNKLLVNAFRLHKINSCAVINFNSSLTCVILKMITGKKEQKHDYIHLFYTPEYPLRPETQVRKWHKTNHWNRTDKTSVNLQTSETY